MVAAANKPAPCEFNENCLFPHGGKWFFQFDNVVSEPYDTSDQAQRAKTRAGLHGMSQGELFNAA